MSKKSTFIYDPSTAMMIKPSERNTAPSTYFHYAAHLPQDVREKIARRMNQEVDESVANME